ncbi:sulfur carrier protein ThiS [Allorhizocola rhizosphaerae]|uniref:sulfur carrier protein ThiS n=1 Tax=Allorhizocola rhizosphaerae TaxID=1872709 RepID=UPI000E3CF777|nr:sulfur carrier protein ThiS [Allorhizocola rhizosphaerae]
MTVLFNDAPRQLATGETVAELLQELVLPPRGIAVAVNGEVVRRADWASHALSDGDRVDVLTASQGG